MDARLAPVRLSRRKFYGAFSRRHASGEAIFREAD